MTRTELEQGNWQATEDWIEQASPADIRDVLNYTECLAIHWPGGATWNGGNRAQLVARPRPRSARAGSASIMSIRCGVGRWNIDTSACCDRRCWRSPDGRVDSEAWSPTKRVPLSGGEWRAHGWVDYASRWRWTWPRTLTCCRGRPGARLVPAVPGQGRGAVPGLGAVLPLAE